jgi:hypothetical protein
VEKMKMEDGIQGDLFALPAFEPLASLLNDDGKPPIIVIGCGRHKKKSPTLAKDLYTSERFKRSKAIATNIEANFFVLSAKHGLLEPNQIVEPYDVEISTLDEQKKILWAESVLKSIATFRNGAAVTILAEKDYVLPLIACNSEADYNIRIITPFKELPPENIPLWLEQAERVSIRIRDLRKLYLYIDTARKKGHTFKFSELPNSKLAKRGVYIFLDPREENFLNEGPRIVRIGTHAVSFESKSTLRTRLRSHFGQMDGGGNHRGSIFRLHVGRALLESGELSFQKESWGEGQHAPAEIREEEVELERKVSTYLSTLEVFVIPVDDEPSKDSLRAHIETQLIALCTENFETIDTSEINWLGHHSPMPPIVKSGLWNLRDVAKKYKPDGLGSVAHLISMQESDK